MSYQSPNSSNLSSSRQPASQYSSSSTQQPSLPGYEGYQPMNYAPTSLPIDRSRNPFYVIGAIGGLLLAIGAFFPWLIIKVADQQIYTTNGMGTFRGPLLSGTNTEINGGAFALGMGLILIVLSGVGFFLNQKVIPIAMLVLGAIATALMFYKWNEIANNLKSETGGDIIVGGGVYIGLIGCMMALAGGIITLVVKRR
jgi:hypothetical protein